MRPGWRDNDDVVSVRLRYEENNPDDGIKVFEPPQDTSGKGFVMVIVTPIMLEWIKKYSSKGITLDDTFHTTRYNLRLATLMVVDERDRGLPGEPRLEAFIQRFGEILGYLRLKGQGVMVDYLEKNYLARTPTWASFANEGAVLDTTMISERFHRRIKEEFLHRNGNSRLDGFVELSIRAVKELAEDVEIKMTAIIEARAVSMAKVDSSEAETILEDAVNQLQVVAKTLGESQTEQLIPRPEMARVGAKPHISCVPLYQVH
ncbi:unnamed protein product [Heligmosomoides polygyrus]|uniref:DNA-directed RNA polymerase n=1 Tax=Heligmosomoides polygyrus TaxID=6339 RepID=A0A183GHS0_HELPZ|nr:unnamed protein product [Heligmosomoides polygyrus]